VNGEIAYEAPKVLKQRDTVPISLTSKGKVSKPVEDEAFIGLRISPYSLWCGYVADGETVHVTTKDENGNPRHKQGDAGREAILDSAAASLFEAWKNLQSNDLKLTALGIVTSGLVDGTKAVMAMNLPEWKDFDITGELVKRVRRLDRSFPEDIFVAVENSANAMTMAIARTRRLRELTEITEDENFIFIQTGSALGTGVFINGHPISCIKDIAPDYYVHLRQAIENVHMGLPTFLHQTVLINRLIARGELALMRKCDDEYPELHLEALVSLDGMIHYAREEEKREGKIIFRKEKVKKIIDALKRDPYSYENTAFELELTNKDILDALDGEKDAAEHAEKVFMRMGMALGSGIYSLTNNLNTQIRHVVILPQMVEDFSKAAMIMKKGIITSLTSSKNDKKGWKVTFMDIDDELFVIAGASVCCE
ncbi:MAG: ROK family protein, partial [Candidatus Latescibacteria bacterium]|nr:ROK family protein [Candidatus Latescibacterota bacterium]